jgi:hemerythrin-like domain-containing protein
MLLNVGRQTDHGFDEPLGLLSDCHRRIEHFLKVLATIAGRPGASGLSAAERAQLQGALTYFATAAPKHTADEEQRLFPRLEAASDESARHALDVVRWLERDHRRADAHHAAVDQLGRRWLAENALSDEAVSDLRHHLAELRELYRAHIAVEDHELFPAAARVLSTSELHAIGREMAARRSTPMKR